MRFVAFGEVLLRLTPPAYRSPAQVASFDSWIGGAEANVAAGLASLGNDAALITALPDNPLGAVALTGLRAAGIDTRMVERAPGRMGLYFSFGGAMHRPVEIVYDRELSAFAQVAPDRWGWRELLAGADRLHLTGITAALGPGPQAAVFAAAEAARELGVPVSFDGNFRQKLWDRWDGRPREALFRLMSQADILFGDFRDIGLALGSTFDQTSDAAANAAFDAFPKLELVAHTIRTLGEAGQQRLSARAHTRERTFHTEEVTLPMIVDRIGAGDAFAAGVLHAGAQGRGPQGIAETGLALACLKHALPGDAPLFVERDLEGFAAHGRDIQR